MEVNADKHKDFMERLGLWMKISENLKKASFFLVNCMHIYTIYIYTHIMYSCTPNLETQFTFMEKKYTSD